jgi:uncharacterized protein
MGRPVVHFEIMGRDGEALRSFYADMFDWGIDVDERLAYGLVDRADNLTVEGIGIGGGIGQLPDGMPGYVTVYVEVPDVEAALQQAVQLGGQRIMGPERITAGVELGIFTDPEGHIVGLLKGSS